MEVQTCRCCLSPGIHKDLNSSYLWLNKKEVYSEMLQECFNIVLKTSDFTSNNICEECIKILRSSCTFKQQVLHNEQMLMKRSPVVQDVDRKPVEVKLEPPPDDADDSDDYVLSDADKNAPEPKEGPASHRRRTNLQILFNNSTIFPFKWRSNFVCFYCAKPYEEYIEFKKHTKSHGSCNAKDYSLQTISGGHIEIKVDVSEINCNVCDEPFNNLDEVIDHLIGKHNMKYDKSVTVPYQAYRLKDFKCLFCDQQFAYFGYLINHVNTVHPQESFVCAQCDASFNKKKYMTFHIKNTHCKKGYSCNECNIKFATYMLLRSHQQRAHVRKCKNCDLCFESRVLLQKHIQADHPDDGNVKCSFCDRKCRSTDSLAVHLKRCKIKFEKQKPESSQIITTVTVKPKNNSNLMQIRKNIQTVLNLTTAIPFKFFNKFACFYCPEKFGEFDELKEHTNLEHPVCDLKCKSMMKFKGKRLTVKVDINYLACKVCSQTMPSLDILIDHLISEHKVNYDKSITTSFEAYKINKDSIACPFCPEQVFSYFGILLKHVHSCHNDNKILCVFCGMSFRTETNMRSHISRLHKSDGYKCTLCDLKFSSRDALQSHSGKFHGTKISKCPECSKTFSSKDLMRRHLIDVHGTGQKCHHCGKLFPKKCMMLAHVRSTHLKEKNVQCSMCQQRFFDGRHLKSHLVKHFGERNFHCDICSKKFLWKKNLIVHMSSHIENCNPKMQT